MPPRLQAALDPLAELRDIHMPLAPDVWPPAPGWWLLAGGLAALAALVARFLRRRRARRRPRRAALRALAALRERRARGEPEPVVVAELAVLVRRAALTRYPRARVAGLTGRAWLELLDEGQDAPHFSRGAGRALATAPYRREEPVDVEALLRLAEDWVKRHL